MRHTDWNAEYVGYICVCMLDVRMVRPDCTEVFPGLSNIVR